jgi:GTP-binding protein
MKEENGQVHEPIESVIVNVADDLSGSVIQMLSDKKGLMQNMFSDNGITTLEFHVPTRGMLGMRSQFILLTKGEGIMYSSLDHYAPHVGAIPKRMNGSMISMADGEAMRFSIRKLQDRGRIFVEPATQLYEGMIVGESAKPGDLTINLTKNKHLTNVRTGKADDNMLLTPIVPLSLEDALGYIGQDEYVEVTPTSIRLRKIHLQESIRKQAAKKKGN